MSNVSRRPGDRARQERQAPAAAPQPEQPQSYEELYQQLEERVRNLESGELSLEQALACYEEGMRFAAACDSLLDAAELRIKRIAGTLADGPILEPWEED